MLCRQNKIVVIFLFATALAFFSLSVLSESHTVLIPEPSPSPAVNSNSGLLPGSESFSGIQKSGQTDELGSPVISLKFPVRVSPDTALVRQIHVGTNGSISFCVPPLTSTPTPTPASTLILAPTSSVDGWSKQCRELSCCVNAYSTI